MCTIQTYTTFHVRKQKWKAPLLVQPGTQYVTSLNPICSLGFQIINSTLFIPSLALS